MNEINSVNNSQQVHATAAAAALMAEEQWMCNIKQNLISHNIEFKFVFVQTCVNLFNRKK